jgi:hypothetical protein
MQYEPEELKGHHELSLIALWCPYIKVRRRDWCGYCREG